MLTQQNILDIIAFWREKLYLDEWKIIVEWEENTNKYLEGDLKTAPHATVVRSFLYDEGTIILNENWVNWTHEQASLNILHELLHCKTRNLDNHFDQIIETMSENNSQIADVYEQVYKNEQEAVIDKLAHIIYKNVDWI